MKLKPKTPTPKQFKNWSIPSQSSFLLFKNSKGQKAISRIALLFAILAFIFTTFLKKPIYNFFYNNKAEKTQNILASYKENKDWFSLYSEIEKVDEKYHNDDWYNYYSGISILKSDASISSKRNMEYYFLKIDPSSHFFGQAILSLLNDYVRIKDKKAFNEKMAFVISKMEVLNYTEPEFYLFKLMSYRYNAKNKDIVNVYQQLKKTYPKIFEKSAGSISFNIKQINSSREVDFDRYSKIYGVTFMCAYHLFEKSSLSKEIKTDIKTLFPTTKEYMFAEMGMSRLWIKMTENKKAKFKNFIREI